MSIILTDLRDRAIHELHKKLIAATPPGQTPAPKPKAANGTDDPLFIAVEGKLRAIAQDSRVPLTPITHSNGLLDSQQLTGPVPLDPKELRLAAIYGILERENEINPTTERFSQAVTGALAEYTDSQTLFDNIFGILAKAGETPIFAPTKTEVATDIWAAITRTLRGKGIKAEDGNLDELARGVLVELRGSDGGLTPSATPIVVPDFEESTAVEIIPPNLHALQVIYFAAMFDEMKGFQVVDKQVEFFLQGMLPLGQGNAGDILYRYWKDSDERLSELERRSLYARCFGFPGGDPQGSVNREFNESWLRFVSATSSYVRKKELDQLLRARIAGSVSQEQVRKSGRDLAANLSLHGYGIAYFAATELQAQLNEIKTLLNDPEIKAAYGARDMFQVIDQVATLELGGAKNGIRYRTMANSGAVIIRWLANRSAILASSSQAQVLNDIVIQSQQTSATKATLDPTDYDLVNACEQWLAVTGTPEVQVEEYAQPSEPPLTTSRPIQIPQIAREMIGDLPIPMAASAAMERSHGNGNGRYGRR